MAIILIDGQEIEIADRERLNVIEAARRAGVEIPHSCWHPGLSVAGRCRMCLVEVGSRDPQTGKIAMLPRLVTACNTPVKDGMVIVTNSEKVRRARAKVEEGLLLRHGQDERRADLRPLTSRRRDLGDVTLLVDRCIMCSRCVRFTREITGTGELMVVRRGTQEEIDALPGSPLENNLSGNVVDLCPVGALSDKDFPYQQQVRSLRRHRGVCTGCAVGCSIRIEENRDRIYRIRPRENPHVNQWWICNDGRYGYGHVHSDRRLRSPHRRDGQSVVELDWSGLPRELEDRLRRTGRLAAVVSPHLTVEEAYLLCKFIRRLDGHAPLVLGPVPMVGEDERFPAGFTILAEKCPNRRGAEAIIAHLTGRVTTFDEFLTELDRGEIRGVWVSGGYKTDWIDEPTARRFEPLELLVVQDLFPSPLSRRAHYTLPGAAFAQRDGSYVNRADRLQTAPRAIRPPSGTRVEGSLYWELLGREGRFNARAVLGEVAHEILYFSAAAAEVPEVGIDLKVNLLADAGTAGEVDG